MAIKLQHLRSSVAGKAPQAADLDVGQIAVNFNDSDPALYIKDSAGSVVRIAGGGAFGGLWTRTGTELSPNTAGDDVFTSGDVKVGNTTAAPKISLNADGSATFAGAITGSKGVKASGLPYTHNNYRASGGMDVDTAIACYNNFAGTQGTRSDPAIAICDTSSFADKNISLNYNGSADFASDVKIGGTLPASPNITLNASGAVSFRNLVLNENSANSSISSFNRSAGKETFKLTGSGGIQIGTDLSVSSKVAINPDGSSTFAGLMTVNEAVRSDRTASSQACFSARLNGTENASIKADGSAKFAGNVQIGEFDETNAATAVGTVAKPGYFRFNRLGATDGAIRIDQAGVQKIAMQAGGSATFAGTVTATVVPPSDAKFKENITPASPQLADIVALGNQLKNFDWNADAPVNDELRAQRQLGLIAQEAEKVCPSLVKTLKRTKQGKELTPETTDADGNVTPATYEELDDSYKGISHDALIMKLLGAVAELQAEVAALKGA